MIRPTADSELDELRAFLSEAEFGAFFVGNLHNYGLQSTVTGHWHCCGRDGKISAVLQRYDGFFLIAAQAACPEFLPVINSYGAYQSLAGRPEHIRDFIGTVPGAAGIKTCMKYSASLAVERIMPDVRIIKTSPADCVRIDELLVAIPEFGFNCGEITERYLRTTRRGEARYWAAELDGTLCACAASAAECPQSAMIVSVGCRPEFRRQGLTRACVEALCRELTAEGKELYLYYENPAAGKMYRELGFRDVGKWMVIE